jgi:hypothetical protein
MRRSMLGVLPRVANGKAAMPTANWNRSRRRSSQRLLINRPHNSSPNTTYHYDMPERVSVIASIPAHIAVAFDICPLLGMWGRSAACSQAYLTIDSLSPRRMRS